MSVVASFLAVLRGVSLPSRLQQASSVRVVDGRKAAGHLAIITIYLIQMRAERASNSRSEVLF